MLSLLNVLASTNVKTTYVAITMQSSPYVHVYPFIEGVGWGAKLANPTTLPNGGGATYNSGGCRISPDGNYLAVANGNSSNSLDVYTLSASGIGTRFSNPASAVPTYAVAVAFSNAVDAIVVGGMGSAPTLRGYRWSSAGFGTAYTDPSISGASVNSIEFSPDGNYVLCGLNGSSTAFYCSWSYASGFGTPTYLSGGVSSTKVAFNAAGTLVLIASDGSVPGMQARSWGPGFGTQYTVGGTNPTGCGVDMSKDGSYVVTSAFYYPWASGFGTGVSISIGNRGIKFSKSGKTLFSASSSSPYIKANQWSNGLGSAYSNPATLPTNQPPSWTGDCLSVFN